jgi:hypothetical protein
MPFPLSMFGTSAAAGGEEDDGQNKVNASAQSWLYESSSPLVGGAFTLSFWFQFNPNLAKMYIFNTSSTFNDASIEVTVTNGGAIQIYIQNQVGTVCKNLLGSPSLTPGEYYSVLVSAQQTVGSTLMYVDDVPISLSGTDGSLSWDTGAATDIALLNSTSNLLSGASGWVRNADLWIDNTYSDFTVEADRRKFVTADVKPVDLGVNGETPYGSPPQIFFGSAYVAANWNSGINLGGGGNLNDGATGWDSFTDV